MGGWTEKVVERDGGWVGRAWWRGGGCAMSAGGRVVGWGRPWEWIGWMWERVEGCEVRSGFVAGYNGITSRLIAVEHACSFVHISSSWKQVFWT